MSSGALASTGQGHQLTGLCAQDQGSVQQLQMLQGHLGSTRGSHPNDRLPKQRPSGKPRAPQSCVASHLLRHPSAQKGPQLKHGKSPSGTKSCLAGMSPAELLLFSFSREIKSIVSTLGPNLSGLKRIAYATWRLQRDGKE